MSFGYWYPVIVHSTNKLRSFLHFLFLCVRVSACMFIAFYCSITYRFSHYYSACPISGQHDGHLSFWLSASVEIVSKLRNPLKYPIPYSRTKNTSPALLCPCQLPEQYVICILLYILFFILLTAYCVFYIVRFYCILGLLLILHVYLSYFTNPASWLPHWNKRLSWNSSLCHDWLS